MRPFNAGDSEYTRSIAIDASTIDGITVTTAVLSERDDELPVLDSIYEAAEGHEFRPFQDKSHRLDYEDSIGFFETVTDQNKDRVIATSHLGQDGSNPERVEAVQSAVLVNELAVDDTLVILDGAADKADRFGRAYYGISEDVPPVVTCIQSEYYYPASLLADVSANHLARQIDHPRHCSAVEPEAPQTKEDFNDRWGSAYNSLFSNSNPVEVEPITQRRAESVASRVNCWYRGWMGGGEPDEFNRSLRPVAEYARRQGYDELASRLLEI